MADGGVDGCHAPDDRTIFPDTEDIYSGDYADGDEGIDSVDFQASFPAAGLPGRRIRREITLPAFLSTETELG